MHARVSDVNVVLDDSEVRFAGFELERPKFLDEGLEGRTYVHAFRECFDSAAEGPGVRPALLRCGDRCSLETVKKLCRLGTPTEPDERAPSREEQQFGDHRSA